MMPMILNFGPAEEQVVGNLVPTYRGAAVDDVDKSAGTPFNFSGRNLVIPGSVDRYVVVFVAMIAPAGTNTTLNPATVTVDGVALRKIAGFNSTPGSSISSAMFGGIVNTPNTSVTISVTHTGAIASSCCIAFFTITGSELTTDVWREAKAYANGDGDIGTHSLATGECLLCFGNHFGNTSTFTWTNAAEQNELNYDTRARTSSAMRTNVATQQTTFASSGGDGVLVYAKFANQ